VPAKDDQQRGSEHERPKAEGVQLKAEIVAVGSELTSGAKLDTNSQWLSNELAAVGIPVHLHTAVADELETLVAVLRAAVERSDVVLLTGGLGPTRDDLTREALARLTGRRLVLHEPSLRHIEQFFARRGRSMPERNRVQALFPEGSEPLPNPVGTAPGVWLSLPRRGRPACLLAALPGVPSEMKRMFREQVRPRLPEAAQVLRRVEIHCYGAGESAIEERLGELTARGHDPEVGITAHEATITLRVTAAGRTQQECEQKVERVRAEIRRRLGKLVFGEGQTELTDAVVQLLRQRGLSLAVAEVGLDGWLTHQLRRSDPAGLVFRGGVVGPTLAKPLASVGLDATTSDAAPVPTATEAAALARRLLAADVGLAVVAVRGPGEERQASQSDVGPSGSVGPLEAEVAAVGDRWQVARRTSLAGNPAIAFVRASKDALDLLRLHLLDERPS